MADLTSSSEIFLHFICLLACRLKNIFIFYWSSTIVFTAESGGQQKVGVRLSLLALLNFGMHMGVGIFLARISRITRIF